MKKTFSVLLALVLALAMTVTAFAKDPSVEEGSKVVGGTVTVGGQEITLTDENISDYVTTGAAKEEVKDVPAGYAVAGSTEVTLADGVTSATITVSVVGVKKGETVMVKYFMNGEWVDLTGVAVADGEVQVTVPGSGSLAVMVAAASTTDEPTNSPNPTESQNPAGTTPTTPAGTTGTGSTNTTKPAGTTGTGSTTSPKTGETNVVLLISLMAVAFAGVAVVAAKKADA